MSARAASRRASRQPTSTVLACCTGGLVTSGFYDSVIGLTSHDQAGPGHLAGHLTLQSGPRVAEARTQMVRQFLEPGAYGDASWLLMLDDDMTFSYDLLDRLHEAADEETHPVVGGLCFAGERGLFVRPTLFRFMTEYGDIEPIFDYPPDELVRVDATGAACLLIHRRVLIAMAKVFGTTAKGKSPYPWFVEGMVGANGSAYGEDIAFCLRLNAIGIPLHVHTGIPLGHIKSTTLDEAAFRECRQRMPELYQPQTNKVVEPL